MCSDTESHADLAKVVNALLLVRATDEAGDDVRLIFDGAAVGWIGALADPAHRSHALFQTVRGRITGACAYCAAAFDATEAVEAAAVPRLDEYRQHPSLRSLVAEGFEVLVF